MSKRHGESSIQYWKAETPVIEYEPNSWGPSEVDQKVSPAGGWQNPIVTG